MRQNLCDVRGASFGHAFGERLQGDGGMLAAILVALAVAVACSMANAFFIAKFRLTAFIVTLAVQIE